MSVLYLIHVPYWGDATLLEILWLIAGIFAACFTVLNLHDSWLDRKALRLIRRDPTVHRRHYEMIKLSARGRVNSQLARLVIAVLIITTGIVGVCTANPLHGGTTWTGFTVTTALVLIGLITAGRSFFDWRQRNLLYEMASGRTEVIARRLRSEQ